MKKKTVKKKKKKTSFFQKLFSWAIILLSIFLIVSIIMLNVLDFIHLWFVMIVVSFIGLIFLLLLRKRKFLIYLFSIIYIGFLGFLSFDVGRTVAFFNDLDLNYKTYNYSVVVLKSSKYKKLDDIGGKKLGYYDDGSNENDKAIDKVDKKVKIEKIAYEDTHKMATDLISGEVDAILIENSYFDILNENIEENGKSFGEMIRKIYGFVILTKTYDIAKDINVTKEPFSIYVSGIDTFGDISSVSRSDVNMVVTVNPKTRQILLTSIPRDYYVKLHGRSGYRDKLTHAGLYGIDMSIQTIEDLLDIDINYYVKVNFSSVVKIVDALGGVNIYSDNEFTSIDRYHYVKGYNKVNGEEALSFARERKSFASGDRQRIKNQQALLSAMFKKALDKDIIVKYNKLLNSINGSFVTNLKMSRFTSLIRMQIAKNYSWNLVTNSLAGEDGSNYTYSAPSVKSYVMLPIDDSVSYAHEIIDDVMQGEILDGEEVTSSSDKASKGKSSVRVEIQNNNSNNNDNNKPKQENKDTNKKEMGVFSAKLVRDSIEFTEGDTFVYHGYTAKYDDTDVTKSSDLIEHFAVNGKTFDEYKDLVLYVSGLEAGDYTIVYTIEYKDKKSTLNQQVKVLEAETSEKDNEEDIDDSDQEEEEETSDKKETD